MSYRVIQAPGCAVLRPDYDAVFATEAEAQALLDLWTRQYSNVRWSIERCPDRDLRNRHAVSYPVNAQWVDGRLHRLPQAVYSRTRG
jgi:hypothetical protein